MKFDNKNQKRTLKAVAAISKSLDKKGRIKGKNKKETKYLKRACGHHYYNRKGKLKPMFFNSGDGHCICEACGREFPTTNMPKEDVKELAGNVLGLANQAVTAAIAGSLGEKAVDKFTNLKVLLEEFPKDYSRTMKAVSKEENLRKKKKKSGNNGGGSSQYGSWGKRH